MNKKTPRILLLFCLFFFTFGCSAPAISPARETQPAATLEPNQTFTHPRGFYSLPYPAGWNLTVTDRAPADEEVSITSPNYQLAGGYPVLEKGAEFLITTKTLTHNFADAEDYYRADPLFNDIAREIAKMSIAGVPALQFRYSYEGVEAVMTAFIAHGRLFQMRYRFVNAAEKQQYMGEYQQLLSSFQITSP